MNLDGAVSLGEFLKGCRERVGLKQIELAVALNLNQSDISKIESNRKEPPISIFKDWTIKTQSTELGIAFLYGTELLTAVPEIMTTVANTVTGFINLFGGWL